MILLHYKHSQSEFKCFNGPFHESTHRFEKHKIQIFPGVVPM